MHFTPSRLSPYVRELHMQMRSNFIYLPPKISAIDKNRPRYDINKHRKRSLQTAIIIINYRSHYNNIRNTFIVVVFLDVIMVEAPEYFFLLIQTYIRGD